MAQFKKNKKVIKAKRGNEKPNILFVENDKFFYLAYKYGLEGAGFNVFIAENGEEALKKIRTENPDLVILDLVMVPKNGFEVLQEMRKDKEMRNVPVFVFSNLKQEDDISKCKALGIDDYWIKTDIARKDIIEKLQNYFLS